jgi:hypothetical protein
MFFSFHFISDKVVIRAFGATTQKHTQRDQLPWRRCGGRGRWIQAGGHKGLPGEATPGYLGARRGLLWRWKTSVVYMDVRVREASKVYLILRGDHGEKSCGGLFCLA